MKLTAEYSRNQGKLNALLGQYFKRLAMVSSTNPNERFVAFNKAIDMEPEINGLMGLKNGQPQKFSMKTFVQLLKENDQDREFISLRRTVKNQQDQIAKQQATIQDLKAKRSETSESVSPGQELIPRLPVVEYLRCQHITLIQHVCGSMSLGFFASAGWMYAQYPIPLTTFLDIAPLVVFSIFVAPYLIRAMALVSWRTAWIMELTMGYVHQGVLATLKFVAFLVAMTGLVVGVGRSLGWTHFGDVPFPNEMTLWALVDWVLEYSLHPHALVFMGGSFVFYLAGTLLQSRITWRPNWKWVDSIKTFFRRGVYVHQ